MGMLGQDVTCLRICHMNWSQHRPKGPKGEKRPADVIGNSVKVMRMATGEEEDVVALIDARAAKPKRHWEVFVAPNANTRRISDIENECRFIKSVWPSI